MYMYGLSEIFATVNLYIYAKYTYVRKVSNGTSMTWLQYWCNIVNGITELV